LTTTQGTSEPPNQLKPDWWLLELEDIERDTSIFVSRLTVSDRDPHSTKSEFKSGDVLYGKLRPYLNKVVVAPEDGYSTTEIVAIRSFVPLCPAFTCLALRRPDFVEYVTMLGRGTKMPRLRTPDALLAPFPLPPLAEQRRIVAKVDELMRLCDLLEAAQKERESKRDSLRTASLQWLTDARPAWVTTQEGVRFFLDQSSRLVTKPEHVEAIRQAVLDLAVQGRLLPQDVKDESAAEALARSDRVRMNVSTKDRRATPGQQELLSADLRWDVPKSWEWRGLADLVLFIDYRGRTPTKTASGVRLVTAKNVRRGFVSFEPEEFISAAEHQRWMTRGLPEVGDVLFTTEAPMGNAAVVRISERFALAQRVINFRPYGAIVPDFLVLQMLSAPFQSILDVTATGLTAKGIKAAKLKRLPVTVPPVTEQSRIVAKVDELMAVCDELETALASAQVDGGRLLEALLREALNGAPKG
jgi:type I restriction enzyme, S subunit